MTGPTRTKRSQLQEQPLLQFPRDGEIRSGHLLQSTAKDVQDNWRVQGIDTREGKNGTM